MREFPLSALTEVVTASIHARSPMKGFFFGYSNRVSGFVM
jgi:hypothetical protein